MMLIEFLCSLMQAIDSMDPAMQVSLGLPSGIAFGALALWH